MKILVTGVSRGIGKALVEQLLNEGHEIWGVSRSSVDVNNRLFHHAVCDIRNTSDIERVANEMRGVGFSPSIVILNAGIEKPDVHDHAFDFETGREMFETNYFGALKWVEMCLTFPERPKQFLAISSVFALRPNDQSATYSATKAALSMVFRGLRLRFLRKDVMFKIVYLVAVNTVIKPSYQVYFSGGKKPPFFVVSPEKAARFIISAMGSQKEDFYSHPLLSYAIRISMFISDRLFRAITTPFRRE